MNIRGIISFCLATLVAASCRLPYSPTRFEESASQLKGTPSWFPLGSTHDKYMIVRPQKGDFPYLEHGIPEVSSIQYVNDALDGALVMVPEPRWFQSFPDLMRREDYLESVRRRNEGAFVQESKDLAERNELKTHVLVDKIMPKPKTLEELPRYDQGCMLKFKIEKVEAGESLKFTLELSAGERAIWRESEHRWTNILPFLFAIYIDGNAVSCNPYPFGKSGGINRMSILVDANDTKRWVVDVSAKNLLELMNKLGGAKAKDIAIVAAFSERQHGSGDWHSQTGIASDFAFSFDPSIQEAGFTHDPMIRKRFPENQIIIRSNVVFLKLDHGTLQLAPGL